MVWIEFAICSMLLIFFAYNLCKEGILVSKNTHIEEGIIGMFLLAIATSFPEIVTSATAVFSLGRIGLGYGDIIGSILINFMILFVLDIYVGKGNILKKVSSLNKTAGIFAMASLGILVISILPSIFLSGGIAIGRIGLESIIIVVIYFIYLKGVHKKHSGTDNKDIKEKTLSFRRVWGKFLLFLILVMFLGMWMALIGEKMIHVTALSQTFIGTLFLGLVTSFPEIIVSVTALRAGSVNMAVGNILGSNLFDVSIIAFLDGLSVSPIMGLLTAGPILMTFLVFVVSIIVVLGVFGKKDTSRKVGWNSVLIFAIGLAGFVILYYVK